MSGLERGSENTNDSENDSHRHKFEKDFSRHRSGQDRTSYRSEGDRRSRHRSEYERRSNEPRSHLHRAKHERRNEGNRYDRHRNRDGRDYCEDRHRSSHRYDKSGRDYQRSQSSRSQSPPPARALLPSGSESNDHESDAAPIEKPNYTPTGLLARAQNTVISTHAKAGTVSKETHIRKYTEPADAAPFAPSTRQISEQTKYEGATSQYRLVRFAKHDNTPLENIRLDQQTSYLVGTDPVLSHIPLSNTKSAEEQHAVIQYRLKVSMDKYGDTHRQIKPYLIDLDSEEGTSLNRDLIPSSRYVELRHKDLLEFGKDGHEYVFIQETTS